MVAAVGTAVVAGITELFWEESGKRNLHGVRMQIPFLPFYFSSAKFSAPK
jgi:hypothetical protein